MKSTHRILVSAFFMVFFLSALVYALVPAAHQFYGTVTVNGNPAPNGAVITARISGIDVESNTVTNGAYGFGNDQDLFIISDQNSVHGGKTITFFVNGVQATPQSTFCLSFACHDSLNLTAGSPAAPPGGQPQGGGGGGSGGSGGTPSTPGNPQANNSNASATPQCVEKWSCTPWSLCTNGLQTRACTDANSCKTTNNQPPTSQPCVIEEQNGNANPQAGQTVDITAFVVATATNPLIAGVILVAGGITAFFLLKRKKSTKVAK